MECIAVQIFQLRAFIRAELIFTDGKKRTYLWLHLFALLGYQLLDILCVINAGDSKA